MKYNLTTTYSETELSFLKSHNCQILSEINLPQSAFTEAYKPLRMFKYGGIYIAEIPDDESGAPVWAILSKLKGKYRYSTYYDSLEALEQGI